MLRRIALWLGLLLILAQALFPIYWMVVTSLRPDGSVYSGSPVPWPANGSAYRVVLTQLDLWRWLLNSFLVSAGTTAFALLVALPAGYSLSRMRSWVTEGSGYVLLAAKTLPPALLVIPLFLVFQRTHLTDTLLSLIIANTSFAVPFCVWMLKGFFDGVPVEIDEAAEIDGAGQLQRLWRVVVPVILPGIVAAALYCFLVGWNEYVFAQTFVTDESKRVATVGLATLFGENSTPWNQVMAASLLVTLPVTLLFAVLQRHLVAGMSAGAVK